jgi:hypothetical protein
MTTVARLVALASGCVLLSACASPEWQLANNDCAARYNAEIPSDYRPMLVVRNQSVPMAGGYHCVPNGRGHDRGTVCYPYNSWGYMPYSTWEMVDINTERRQAAIRACTASACLNRYGNSACDAAPPGGSIFGSLEGQSLGNGLASTAP